jgi:hypothetical protein
MATLVVVFLCLLSGGVSAAQVTIVLSELAPPYTEVADSIRAGLKSVAEHVAVNVVPGPLHEGSESDAKDPEKLYIAIGSSAARSVHGVHPTASLLATLIPRETFAGLAQAGGIPSRATAIFLEQPLTRQLALINLALPGKKRVAAVLGPHSRALLPELERRTRAAGLTLVSKEVARDTEVVPALRSLLPECDILLAVPDPDVYSATSVQNILLLTYRQRVPVVAFSQSYVKAGALAAVHTTPAQFGEQAVELVEQMLRGGRWVLPEPRGPKYFSIAYNRDVARSLGLGVVDEPALMQRLRETGNE